MKVYYLGPFYSYPEENWSNEEPNGLCSKEGDISSIRCSGYYGFQGWMGPISSMVELIGLAFSFLFSLHA